MIVEEYNNYYNIKIVNNNETFVKLTYNMSKEDHDRVNCDLYNTLRRGKNQKVIGYSLYGKERRYYNLVLDNVELAEKRYPSWIVRIYYNESVLPNISCLVECHQNRKKNNSYYDNADFCNINKITNSIIDLNDTWDANYTHAMSWRWYKLSGLNIEENFFPFFSFRLPLGDTFVDYFASRDIDGWLIEREVGAVNEWMNSNTLFHIMRGKKLILKNSSAYIY